MEKINSRSQIVQATVVLQAVVQAVVNAIEMATVRPSWLSEIPEQIVT